MVKVFIKKQGKRKGHFNMAMGYSGVSEIIITWEELEKTNLVTFNKFKTALNESTFELEDILYNYYNELGSEFKETSCYHKIVEHLEELIDEFEEVYDLKLIVGFHESSDYGDNYDEVDGGYFALWGVHQLTDGAKKLKETSEFNTKYWVHYG